MTRLTDLPAHLREMLGELCGQDPPEEAILQRLYDMNPRYRVTFRPGTSDITTPGVPAFEVAPGVIRPGKPSEVIPGRPPLWALHEVRPANAHDHLRRQAGEARLRRFHRWPAEVQERRRGVLALCWEMIHGYWPIGEWPAVPTRTLTAFGSEAFFHEVAEGEVAFRAEQARLAKEAALDETADEQTLSELDENPAFRAAQRDAYRQAAIEDYALIFKGRKGVLIQQVLEADDGRADRERVERSGHGEAREPGQHHRERVPGEGPDEAPAGAGGLRERAGRGHEDGAIA